MLLGACCEGLKSGVLVQTPVPQSEQSRGYVVVYGADTFEDRRAFIRKYLIISKS